MKAGSFLLFTLLLFFLYSNIAAKKINVRNYCKGYPKNMCTLEYSAHCGSDGKTYGNKCDFCHAYICSDRKLQLRNRGECAKFEYEED